MNIYVGNIAWGVSDDELEALFAQYGEVNSARIITDRESGRSKGFGFVEMATADSANAAIEALNGNDFGGRDLRVNQAKERT
ncbi:MAG TPA: RNA-binding protein [SAR86 cluster bacterium]|jgi:RNA recognition motif-containing protein|nr:RNA-binding protein [SAR86 cluster bacterium]|tara:strand:- start:13 stop:258 length:246 start_codon:yes stop_codon:yes gene_type:complete